GYGQDQVQGYETPDLLLPTRPELDYTLCSAVVAGAGGVFFYPYRHPTRYEKARIEKKLWPYTDYEPLPKLAPTLWGAIQGCVSQARAILQRVHDGTLTRDVEPVHGPGHLELGQWRL